MTDPLRNKLNNWEATPPPGAWDSLARELAEYKAEKNLAERLQATENSVPPMVWQAIASQLADASGAKSENPAYRLPVPVRPLYPYLFRYGAAAILIGFLAWVLFENPFSKPESVTVSVVPAENKSPEKLQLNPINSAPVIVDENPVIQEIITATPLAAGYASNVKYPKREPRHAIIRARNATISRAEERQVYLNKPPQSALKALAVQNPDPRYIRITDQNGSAVKLSAKFAPLYYHLSNQGSAGFSESNIPALNKLEQRIRQTAFAPDPANLFDLLRLREILQQEN